MKIMNAKIEEPNKYGVYCNPYKEITYLGEKLWCVKIGLHSTAEGIRFESDIFGSLRGANTKSPTYQSEWEAETAFLALAEREIKQRIEKAHDYTEIDMQPYGRSAYVRHLAAIKKIIAKHNQLQLL